MAVTFPNPSRIYDATRRAVRFWGYDQSMEISFFVTEAALKALLPRAASVADDLLAAFDSNRARIYAAAEKALGRGRKGSYELGPNDL
jgi:hypothetical protein